MNVLLISRNRSIKFPKIPNVVNDIRVLTNYISQMDKWYTYDVIMVDETVTESSIGEIRDDYENTIIIGTGKEKKYILDYGLNAYLQSPYTDEELFQAIALANVTHYLLVTYPLTIKDKLEKRNICFM